MAVQTTSLVAAAQYSRYSRSSEACIMSISELALVADFVSTKIHFEIEKYDN